MFWVQVLKAVLQSSHNSILRALTLSGASGIVSLRLLATHGASKHPHNLDDRFETPMVAQRMGQRTFVTHFRGIVSDYEVFESKVPSHFNVNDITTMNIEKAKQAFDNLQREKEAQQHRLQLAAEAKQRLDNKR